MATKDQRLASGAEVVRRQWGANAGKYPDGFAYAGYDLLRRYGYTRAPQQQGQPPRRENGYWVALVFLAWLGATIYEGVTNWNKWIVHHHVDTSDYLGFILDAVFGSLAAFLSYVAVRNIRRRQAAGSASAVDE